MVPPARRRKALRGMGGQVSADSSEPLFEVLSKFGKVLGLCGVSGRLTPLRIHRWILANFAGFVKRGRDTLARICSIFFTLTQP